MRVRQQGDARQVKSGTALLLVSPDRCVLTPVLAIWVNFQDFDTIRSIHPRDNVTIIGSIARALASAGSRRRIATFAANAISERRSIGLDARDRVHPKILTALI